MREDTARSTPGNRFFAFLDFHESAKNMPKRELKQHTADTEGKKPKKAKVQVNKPKNYAKLIDDATNFETTDLKFTEEIPSKNKNGQLEFPDWPEFRPNLTPKEVLQAGSFGGTYFRSIRSGATGKSYSGTEVYKELPCDWFEGLNIAKQVTSASYRTEVNTYKVKCGGSLDMWEESGWIHKQDPYGWFQWYCRFYQGRRTSDDERQVGRWLRCAGVTGRWRNNLISKCVKTGCSYDNKAVSPVVRQTLQHWAYKLNSDDFNAYVKKKGIK
ncbi:uncharacterized protein LOC132550424 isoform X1 [Ylistrum balloti]|uniref:uncharacterized protein LOC132550424 isoform X1 n=2 Tax=Ylistrum balloti TaxID=509963 RepID=UPI002905ABEE|nr:uncharacterized protein LOC132550424 isoform X1 [Ylistrum balloti]